MPRKSSKDNDDENLDDFGEGEVGKSSNGGSCFFINKSGLPMDNPTWERMWDHVTSVHPDGDKILREIRRSDRRLLEVPVPHAPLCFSQDATTPERIDAVQKYLKQLQYNHTGTQFFDIKKGRPLCGLMDCAKDMIRESLPIKCLEAVVLAIYLTNSLVSVDRFPISFRSVFKGNVYHHIVLGVHFNGHYGAVGLSRRDDLMYKPLQYSQLSEMVLDFQKSYRKYWHTVDKVKVGLAVSHDPYTYECIHWRAISINMKKLSQHDICHELDKFSREIRKHTTRWQTTTSAYVAKQDSKARSLSPKKHVVHRQPHPPPYPPLPASVPVKASQQHHHRVADCLLPSPKVNSAHFMDPAVMVTIGYGDSRRGSGGSGPSYSQLQCQTSDSSIYSTVDIYDLRI